MHNWNSKYVNNDAITYEFLKNILELISSNGLILKLGILRREYIKTRAAIFILTNVNFLAY